MEWNVGFSDKQHRVKLPDHIPDNAPFTVEVNGRSVLARWQRATKSLYILDTTQNAVWSSIHTRSKSVTKFPGESDLTVSAEFTPAGSPRTLCLDATVSLHLPHSKADNSTAKKPKVIRSQITGKVLKVMVKTGDQVNVGDTALIIEAMKMENRILVTAAGVVETVKVKEGETVATGAELVRFK